MNFNDILTILQSVSIILLIIVSLGTIKGRNKDETATLTEMRVDIRYIKDSLENMRGIEPRLFAVEESAKQAHKRLDEHIKRSE